MNGTNGKRSDFPDVDLVPYPVIRHAYEVWKERQDTIWAPFTKNAPQKQTIKETPGTCKNIVFMRVFGVF